MVRSAGQPNIADLATDDDDGGFGSDGLQLLQGGSTIQQSRTRFTSALKVQKERSIDIVLKKTLDEAARAGEGFFYAWTVKDKHSSTGESIIEGIGIKGSMILVRNWGNCTVTVDVVSETPSHWTLSAGFVDFETGFNIDRLFRQRKGQDGGKYDAERKLDINFQIGQSKAVRNIVVNALPSWIQDMSLETAKEASAGKYKEVGTHVVKFLRRFAELGVTKAQLELKVGLPTEQWEPRDLVMLAAIGRAIKDRQTSVDNEFPKPVPAPVAPVAGTAGAPVADGEFVDSAASSEASAASGTPAAGESNQGEPSHPAATTAAQTAPPGSPTPVTGNAHAVPPVTAKTPIDHSNPPPLSAEEMAEIAKAERDEAEASRGTSRKRTRTSGDEG